MTAEQQITELQAELDRHRAALVELAGLMLPTAVGHQLALAGPRERAVLSSVAPSAFELWQREHPVQEFRDVHNQHRGDDDEHFDIHRQGGWVDAINGGVDPRRTR